MTEQQAAISLSVIVPCYNVEPYLDKSLQCLERQWGNRTDYEIILVNDGSVDGTIDKLNEFQERHPDYVKVIDKRQNEGVAAARNSGLDIARGAWITFFDPDDLMADRGYDRLLALTEKGDFDILRFGVERVWEGNPLPSSGDLDSQLSIDWEGTSVAYMLENTFGTCWSYLFKREVLDGHRFPPLTICEDTVFNLSVLLENRAMARTLHGVYHYIVRPTSATNTVNRARLSRHSDDILQAICMLEDFKQGQGEAVRRRLKEHQFVFSPNLLTRLLLSDKPLSGLKEHLAVLKGFGLFPLPKDLPGANLMMRLVNLAYQHPFLLPLLRLIYRKYRTR